MLLGSGFRTVDLSGVLGLLIACRNAKRMTGEQYFGDYPQIKP
jgi:hypothetical protein